MFCSNCGNALSNEAAFCSNCGTPRPALVAAGHAAEETVTDQEPQAPAAPAPAPAAPAPAHLAPPAAPAAPAGATAAVAIRATATSMLTRMRVDQDLATTAAKHAAIILGGAVVLLAIVGAAVIAAATDLELGLTELLRLAVFVTGTAFGAAVKASGDFDFYASATGEIKAWFIPTLVTLLLAGAVAALSARHERRRGSATGLELLGGALTTGAVTTAALLLLGLLSRGSFAVSEGGDSPFTFEVHLSLLSLFFGGLLVATVASLIGRAYTLRHTEVAAAARARITSRIPAVAGDLQTPALFLATLLALGSLTVLVALAFDNEDYLKSVLVALPVLPTASLAAAALGMGATGLGTMTASGEFLDYGSSNAERYSVGMFGADDHVTYFLLLLPLAAALIAGLAAGARRPVMTNKLKSVWKAGAATAGMFLLLGLMLRFTASVSATASYSATSAGGAGHASAHMGLVSLVLASFLWGCLARAAGVWLMVPLACRLPRTVEFAGRRAARLAGEPGLAAPWAAELAGLARQLGKDPRPDAVAGLEPGYVPAADGTFPHGLVAKRGTGKIVAAVGAVVVVLGGAWLTLDKVVAPHFYGPDAQARAYFDRLQSGDAAGVLAMADGKPARGPLLTTAALQQQLKGAPIKDVQIRSVDESDGWATVKASYRAGDTTYRGAFDLIADEKDKHFGIWPTWKLSTSTATIDVSAGDNATSVAVDGIDVGDGTFDVFPGTHQVEAVADETMYDTTTRRTDVGFPGDVGNSSVDATLNAATTQQIEQAAIDAVKACAEEGVTGPADCSEGWPYITYDDSTKATYTWAEEPTATVYNDDYDGLSVDVTGSFNVVYNDWGRTSEDYDLDMTGTVDLDSGSPHITWSGYWDW